MIGPATSPLYMRPANELVAEGFERARCCRDARAQAAIARKFAEDGTIDREAGAMVARWLDAWADRIEQRLFDEEVDPRRIIRGEG